MTGARFSTTHLKMFQMRSGHKALKWLPKKRLLKLKQRYHSLSVQPSPQPGDED